MTARGSRDEREDWIPLPSRTEGLILELLRHGRELFGLELVECSDGRLKRGTVYVTLNRMEEKGYVESHLEETPPSGDVPRRLYRLTPLGRRMVAVIDLARAPLKPATAR